MVTESRTRISVHIIVSKELAIRALSAPHSSASGAFVFHKYIITVVNKLLLALQNPSLPKHQPIKP